MADYTAALQTLKTMLRTEETFSNTYRYFFDHVSMNQNFIADSKRETNKQVQMILQTTGDHIFGKKCEITNLVLLRVESKNFVHGACGLGGCFAAVMYFEDIDMGMIAICTNPATSCMQYGRFSITKLDKDTHLDEDKLAHFNPRVSKALQ